MASRFRQFSFRALLLDQLFIAIAISFLITLPLTGIPAYIILNQTINSDIENIEELSHQAINEHLVTGWQPHNVDKVYRDLRINMPNAALFLQKSPQFIDPEDDVIEPTTPTTVAFARLIEKVEINERSYIETNILEGSITAAIPIVFKSQCLVCHGAQVRTGEIYNGALAGTLTLQAPMSVNRLSASAVLIFAAFFLLIFTIIATVITNKKIQTNLLTPLEALNNRVSRLKISSHEQHEIDWQRTPQKMVEIDEIDASISEHVDSVRNLYHKLDALLVTEHDTGLFTRDRFNEVIQYEMDRTRRYKRPFSLLIIKLSDIRILNATAKNLEIEEPGHKYLFFGHALNNEIRDTDMAFRLEEHIYAVVAPETDELGVEHVQEDLNQRLINTSYNPLLEASSSALPEYELTMQEGSVTYNGEQVDAKELLKHAIQMMQADQPFTGNYPGEKLTQQND